MTAIIIRAAATKDADQKVAVLRRSIIELCVADHQNHEQVLEAWLANKTPAMVLSWISQDDQQVLVATRDERIVGVGAATKDGIVLLNYVLPDCNGMGVSTRILGALEAFMIKHEQEKVALKAL